jgi:PD-(D/E)XK endonuclease
MAEHGRYDLGFELGDRILRVQCKWGALDEADAVVRARLSSSRLTFSGQHRKCYLEHEIDLLAVIATRLTTATFCRARSWRVGVRSLCDSARRSMGSGRALR